MDTTDINTKFERLGARAKIRPLAQNRWQPESGRVVIDVRHDRHGEFFDIQADQDATVEVLDVQPRDRHLLLMVRRPNQRPGLPDIKDKLLCGHDERHWFVAGVPERAPVSTVVTAKLALKPDAVRDREQGKKGKRQKQLRRKTDVFIRQGEDRCPAVRPSANRTRRIHDDRRGGTQVDSGAPGRPRQPLPAGGGVGRHLDVPVCDGLADADDPLLIADGFADTDMGEYDGHGLASGD
jgi:hypothetical protein